MNNAEWKLVVVANNSQRCSSNRVRQKVENIKQFAREAVRKDKVSQPVSSDDREKV